jgi:hypothetical protein
VYGNNRRELIVDYILPFSCLLREDMQFSLAGMGTGGRCDREGSGRKKGIKGIKEKVVKQIRILLYREIVTTCLSVVLST